MPKRCNKRRPGGLVSVQVYLGRGLEGKRKTITVYGRTQTEAEEKAAKIKMQHSKGLDASARTDTFEKWANRFLENKKVSGVSAHQYTEYQSTVKILNSKIGDIPICKLRQQNIQSVINGLAERNPATGQPSAKRTLGFYLSTVRQILQLAVKNQIIDHNAADGVEIPRKAPAKKRQALTEEEQRWIVEMPHRAQLPAMIMLFAGLRRCEVLALTWSDIDLEERSIRVRKDVEFRNGKPYIKNFTKTAAGVRDVFIPPILAEYLKKRKEEFKVEDENALVCPSERGKLMSDTAWRRLWNSYMKDLNFKYGTQIDKRGKKATSKFNRNGIPMTIQPFTAHCLRHTYATNLYLAKIDPETVKKQLGHANITTTLQIYTHIDKDSQKKAMEAYNPVFPGSETTDDNVEQCSCAV